jgi:ParB/RepB/Spo0J family partition protein
MMELEHHQLILRYEHLRLRCPQRERRLLASLAQHGQQMPIVVVSEEAGGFVVVDGYKRVRAMRRLGCDTLQAACWDMGEAEALLLGRLMRTGAEQSAFEQGLWLRELHLRFALSLDELSRRFDRSVSWVSRRLALVGALPETVQKRVLGGEMVAHAAMKYLVPLARANRADCERFTEAVAGRGLTTRQVGELVVAYRSGGASTRALVLSDPLLVLKARCEASRPVGGEPHSACGDLLRDFEVVAAVARRALKRLCEGAAVGLAPAEREDLLGSFRQARRAMERLAGQIHKEMDDAGRAAAHGDPPASSPGDGPALDRQGDGDRTWHGAQGDPLGVEPGAASGAFGEGRAAPREDPGVACLVQGQPGAGA